LVFGVFRGLTIEKLQELLTQGPEEVIAKLTADYFSDWERVLQATRLSDDYLMSLTNCLGEKVCVDFETRETPPDTKLETNQVSLLMKTTTPQFRNNLTDCCKKLYWRVKGKDGYNARQVFIYFIPPMDISTACVLYYCS
jgi:hypothetical protein